MKNGRLRCPVLSILIIFVTVAMTMTTTTTQAAEAASAPSVTQAKGKATFMNGLRSRFRPLPEGQFKYILAEGTGTHSLSCYSNLEPYHPFGLEMTTSIRRNNDDIHFRVDSVEVFSDFDQTTNRNHDFLTKNASGSTLSIESGRFGSLAAPKYGEVLRDQKVAGWHLQGRFDLQISYVPNWGGRTMLLFMKYEGVFNELYAYCEEVH